MTWHVYQLSDSEEKAVIYIGMTADIHTRMLSHSSIGPVAEWMKSGDHGRDCDLKILASFETRADAASMEDALILERRPVLNKARGGAGRPRLGEEEKTLTAMKPWITSDPPMSRRSWYRRQREKGGR